MQRYAFLEPFQIGSRLVTSQAELDAIWIDPASAAKLADPKKGEPKIRVIEETAVKHNKKGGAEAVK